MKKNLISIVILALLIVNIVMSAIMMFGVMSTNKKTAALVGKIASAISLDLGEDAAVEEVKKTVSIEDTVPYTIGDLMIPLKKSEGDEKDHYALLSVTFSMDGKSKDYKKYGDLSTMEDLMRGRINDAVGQFTIEEISADPQIVKDEILNRIQALFDSDFVFDVTLSSANYQ